jgi:rfaE bifunctional protein nucleotidyltransferase chain/domain/rfaE bifunctional protein kinase chain/domain
VTGPVVVVGDSLLDIDLVGAARRLAPDAPVPVLADAVEHARPGGAALCAALVAELSAGAEPVVLITALPDDADAARLMELATSGVRVIRLPRSGATPVKTRVRAENHPLVRLDRGGDGTVTTLPDAAAGALAEAGAVLVADYGAGTTRDHRLRALLAEAATRVPLVWDPHPRGPDPVPGATLVTPNEREAAAAAPHVTATGLRAIALRSEQLRAKWSARSVAVTLGSAGAMLNQGSSVPFVVPAPRVDARDECGAGDCFAASAALALAKGALPTEAVAAAVRAAAAFVAAGGAHAAGLRWSVGAGAGRAAREQAGSDPQQQAPVQNLIAAVREQGGTVVATGGCFDLLHAGHVATLEAARRLGSCLIVCLNSDASVRRLKGSGRPLQAAADRAHILRALSCVDAVVTFEEDTPLRILDTLRPDVWVKGGDYSADTLPEAPLLAGWGGQVVAVPYLPERSTTRLVSTARSGAP